MHYTSQKDPILKKKRVRQVILTNALDRSYAFVAKRPNDSLAIPKGSNKLSAQKSKTKKLTADLEMQERIPHTNQNYLTVQEHDAGTSSVSTNAVMMTNLATEMIQHSDKKSRTDEPSMYDNQEVNYHDEESKSVVKEEKNNEYLVDCEQSIDVGEESMHQNAINFDVKSDDDLDALERDQNNSSHGNGTGYENQGITIAPTQDEHDGPNERQGEDKEESDQDRTAELQFEQQNMHKELKKQRKANNKKKRDIVISSDASSNITKDDENASGAIKSAPKRGGFEGFYQFDERLVPNPKNKAPSSATAFPHIDISSPVHRRLNPSQDNENMRSERRLLSRVETEIPDSEEKNEKDIKQKRKKKRNAQDKNKEPTVVRRLDEAPEMQDLEKQQEEKEEEILYVERRYCTKCGLEQPIRAKHCKDCERCVSQYDHHCPWLGTCIGERNHNLFFWFLVFQFIEMVWGEFKVFEYMFTINYQNWASENAGRVALAVILGFFTIMVCSLICFHSYLAIVNLTTWESLSWYKISYLREWHEDWGSPFSEGAIKNLKFFCCSSKNELRRWEMPKYKRPLENQDSKTDL